jgi:DNA-binding winged helix-turn-helix (wHTH) protein
VTQATTIRFDEYELDLTNRELRKYGCKLAVERKPFRVLELLLRRPGELVTREELVQYLWPDSHVSFDQSLNTAVNTLRAALGDSPKHCRFIETRPGIGYRFCGTIKSALAVMGRTQSHGGREDYLKGRYFLDKIAEEDTHKAIAFFKSAAWDAGCGGLAHAGLADAYCQIALMGLRAPSLLARDAHECADAALQSGPASVEACVAAARVNIIFDWNSEAAAEHVSRALALNEESVPAQTARAWLLCLAGEYKSAHEASVRAVAVDPLSFAANLQFATCLYAQSEWERAAEQCWKMLTLSHCFAPAQMLLGMVYEQMEMYEEALIEFRNAQQCSAFEPAALSNIGRLCAAMSLEREADQARASLMNLAKARYVSAYWLALLHANRNTEQQEQLFQLLEQCVRERDPVMLGIAADKRFDGFRKDERFQAMFPVHPETASLPH